NRGHSSCVGEWVRGRLVACPDRIGVLEGPAQIDLATLVALRQFFELQRDHGEIRFKTFCLYRSTGRSHEPGGGETDGPMAGQRYQTFDRALAKSAGAQQHGSAIIL